VTAFRASVIIPARNECGDVGGCVEAVARQTISKNEMEVILVDGVSTDGTVAAARAAARACGLNLIVRSNERGTAATSLNLGLGHARGEVIVRVDARSRIGPRHVELACQLLEDRELGVVGGGQLPQVRAGANVVERAIARSLRNRYTTGFARYRRSERPGSTDTVWMGAFRRHDLLALGGWPVFPEQNQDFRLNQRFREQGLHVWFHPELSAGYLPRRTLQELARQYVRFGRAKGTVWRQGERLGSRHVAVLLAPIVGLALVGWGCRRWGLGPVVAGTLATGLLLDHVGVGQPASMQERSLAVLATVAADGSWLVGVLIGVTRP
jgi:succinoglycan biosynthesis protein ExoA